jgi:hypothetical protein
MKPYKPTFLYNQTLYSFDTITQPPANAIKSEANRGGLQKIKNENRPSYTQLLNSIIENTDPALQHPPVVTPTYPIYLVGSTIEDLSPFTYVPEPTPTPMPPPTPTSDYST